LEERDKTLAEPWTGFRLPLQFCKPGRVFPPAAESIGGERQDTSNMPQDFENASDLARISFWEGHNASNALVIKALDLDCPEAPSNTKIQTPYEQKQ
jgi:hypothetical protein